MLDAIRALALKCIRCGICLDACPTYRITGREPDSPRGRIHLMRAVAEGRAELGRVVLQHIDACLGCRACEAACPSAVRYSSILEGFRSHVEASGVRPAPERMARRELVGMMADPFRMAAGIRASSAVAGTRVGAGGMPSSLADLLAGDDGSIMDVPGASIDPTPAVPAFSPAIGRRRAVVAVLPGCAMRTLFSRVNAASVRVLQRAGCDVLSPPDAGCCGALHAHGGYHEDARNLARRLIDTLGQYEFDRFVVNSAGCGSTMKEYGDLLADDPAYAGRARDLSARVSDISEYLVDSDAPAPEGDFPYAVAYHDACHLIHGQGVSVQPRRLLEELRGIRLKPLRDAAMCCGSAGFYNIVQPRLSADLLREKIDRIVECGAEVIAASNPGCMAWIAHGCAARELSVRVLHPMEILDEAAMRSGA